MNVREATLVIDREFAKLVGLGIIKKRAKQWLLGGIADKGFLPPLLFVAPPGTGKSKLMKVLAGLARACLGRTPLYFEHGEALGSRIGFVEDVLVHRFHDKEAIIFGDEIHEAKKPVLTLLRSMLEVTVERAVRTIPAIRDYEIAYDPCRNGIVLATNKIDLLDSALVGRLERWDFPLYTDDEMEEILRRALRNSGITFNENSLRSIAECNRGTARDIVHWQNALRTFVAIRGKATVNRSDIKEIIVMRETYPLGVTNRELNTLLFLERDGDLQLKELAARNIINTAEQNADEKYLLQRALIEINVKRHLTPKGRDFLKMLRKHKFIKG